MFTESYLNICVYLQPQEPAAPAEAAVAPPPSMPMMFNPSQFPSAAPATAPSASNRAGPRYGQRRAYPK